MQVLVELAEQEPDLLPGVIAQLEEPGGTPPRSQTTEKLKWQV